MKSFTFFLLLLFTAQTNAQTINITGPAGSGQFGATATVLTNGNYVVTDPLYDEGTIADVGAVYLYNGNTHAVISILKGSKANDQVGSGGVTTLPSGNFVVSSPYCDNGIAVNAGAATWVNGVAGISGVVSSSNSLVGAFSSDYIGTKVTSLSNGNYVVSSMFCNSMSLPGSGRQVGAVTWGNGTTGIKGIVTPLNSLSGVYDWDNIGSGGVIPLNNGNYVVLSPLLDFNTKDIGAVTWCNGLTGKAGYISSGNSLVGSNTNDEVGSNGIQILSNNNYRVLSPNWHNGDGAITWCNGTTGFVGIVSTYNSLVGYGCNSPVTFAGNDYYYLANPLWDNGSLIDVGAVTWGSGTTGICGVINNSNSLIGSTAYDRVGSDVQILSNGNYVVLSPDWNNGIISKVGAVTFGDKDDPIKGFVSTSNSLTGSTANDSIGSAGIIALANGSFVVGSPKWDNGTIVNAGAATLVNGAANTFGVLSSSNSLVGNTANDMVGLNIYSLYNGNYVVCSTNWNNGTTSKVGAVTFGNGVTGITGLLNSSNSLVGSSEGDSVGSSGIDLLNNDNFIIKSPGWNNGIISNAGAATWSNGISGISGIINAGNSLVGSSANDNVGVGKITTLSNGNYVIASPKWDNGANIDAGAITWGNGNGGTIGTINSDNSLVGDAVNPLVNVGITALNNGNFLVTNPNWNNGAANKAGAITWGSGITGVSGLTGSNNSLIGTTSGDNIGSSGIIPLSNGNFIVKSPKWHNGPVVNAGAITWGNGSTGISGAVNSSNSLVGNAANPLTTEVTLLSNNNYLIINQDWNNGPITRAGAVTWGNGQVGVSGLVSNSNSLVGSKINDSVGSGNLVILNNGGYIVNSPKWDNGANINSGAITLGDPNNGVRGFISSCNSVTETSASGGASINSIYNNTYNYLIAGRPYDNMISIFNPANMTMAEMQDSISQNIYALSTTPLIASGGCRIIATIAPNGTSPVNGTVNAKVWIEPFVPVYDGDPFVARHYQVTPLSNAPSSTARLTLYFTQQEFDDFNAHPGSALNLPAGDGDATGIANLRVGKYPGISNNGSGLPVTYSDPPVIIDPIDADIIWNGDLSRWEISFDVTGFSGFVVQTKATALPLQLLDFSAAIAQNDALLKWKTTNETNTHSFEVQRSTDGRSFIKLGTVVAVNSTADHTYHYTDAGAALLNVNKLYYRLKMIDDNGSYKNSAIILLMVDKNNTGTVYPNPVTNLTMLSFSNSNLIGSVAVLTDMLGKQVQQCIISSYQQPIDMSQLAKGMYILKLKEGTAVKLIKN